MISKFIKIVFFLIASLTIMSLRCNKEIYFKEAIPVHDFVQKISLAPYAKVYHVGDTIRLEVNTISKTLYDNKSGLQVLADSFLYNAGFNVTEIFPLSSHPENYCNIVIAPRYNPNLNNYATGFSAHFSYGCDTSNSGFKFSTAIVLKAQGYFGIQLVPKFTLLKCLYLSDTSKQVSQVNYSFDLTDCNKDVFDEANSHLAGNYYETFIDNVVNKQMFVCRVE